MAKEFRFPDVGEGITEGEIVRWLVKEGDEVKADQTLAEIETDKAVVEMPSPYAGTVLKLHFKEKDLVKVGQALVTIGEKGESLASEAGPNPSPLARPAARPRRAVRTGAGPAKSWPPPRSGRWPTSSASTSAPSGARARAGASPRTTSGRPRPAPRRKEAGDQDQGEIRSLRRPSSGSPCAASAGPRPRRCANPWTTPPT